MHGVSQGGQGGAGPAPEQDLGQVPALAALAARLLHAPWAVVGLEGEQGTSWVRVAGDGVAAPGRPAQQRWARAAVEGGALVLPDLTRAPTGVAGPGAGVCSWATAAVHAPDGRRVGCLGVADDVARAWSADDLETLRVLAGAAASEVALRQALRAARQGRSASRAPAEAADLLLGVLDPQEVLQALTGLAAPGLASWCTAWVPEGGALRVAAGSAADGSAVHWPDVDLAGGSLSARAFRTRVPQAEDDLTAHLARTAQDEAIAERSARLDVAAAYAVPLLVQGAPVGVLTLMRHRGEPPFGEADRRSAEQLAARAAVALSAALQQAQHRHTAEVLQRSLLPVLPVLPELELASAYRPAGGTEVGGDFFDAVDLGAGRVALCIGDVMGRGVRAAAVMGQLRTAVRAYARLDVPPARLLAQLNALVDELPDAQLATCFYGVLDVAAGTLTYASAGHLAPLLRRDGAASVLAGPVGGAAGLRRAPVRRGGPARPARRPALPLHRRPRRGPRPRPRRGAAPGRRGAGRGRRQRRRAAWPTAASGSSTWSPAGRRTTSRCCSCSCPAPAPPRPVRRGSASSRCPAGARPWSGTCGTGPAGRCAAGTPTSTWSARRRWWSASWSRTRCCTACRPVRVRLRSAGEALSVEVFDQGHVLPDRGEGEPEEESGRGLLLVEVLANRWGSRASGTGKVVWAELPLPDAVGAAEGPA